jgi:hypothetical protein
MCSIFSVIYSVPLVSGSESPFGYKYELVGHG